MKHPLLTTIAAVLLVGYGESQSPKPPTAKALDINIHKAAQAGNIEAVKQHLAAGTDVNAMEEAFTLAAEYGHKEIVELLIAKGADVNATDMYRRTPLDMVIGLRRAATIDLLRKHGGKTRRELKAEGK